MIMIEQALSGKGVDCRENQPLIKTTELVHRCRDMAAVDALTPEFKFLFAAIADRLERYQFALGRICYGAERGDEQRIAKDARID